MEIGEFANYNYRNILKKIISGFMRQHQNISTEKAEGLKFEQCVELIQVDENKRNTCRV